MDKKEINSTKLTLNFLVWIGGVFMLLLFALLAHFVWRFSSGSSLRQKKAAPLLGPRFKEVRWWVVRKGDGSIRPTKPGGTSGNVE
jgi:heme/copper-type cytochrome/quinol oxidase subunit 2